MTHHTVTLVATTVSESTGVSDVKVVFVRLDVDTSSLILKPCRYSLQNLLRILNTCGFILLLQIFRYTYAVVTTHLNLTTVQLLLYKFCAHI